MKLFFAALMTLSLSAQAAPVKLNFTHSSDSVQGLLYDILNDYKLKMDSVSTFEYEGIKRDGSKLIVEAGADRVVCDGRTLGMAAVMSYACDFSKGLYPWNMSSNSVAAVLHSALADFADQHSRMSQLVKKGPNGELILQDDRSMLECHSDSPGMTPVQQYQCKIETN